MSRTVTPSAEKWLLNELAAARGDLVKIERELEMAQSVAEQLAASLGQQRALCQSLEKVLHLTTGEDNLAWTKQVGAHRLYGGRGSLRKWLRVEIQGAHPQYLDSMALFEKAIPAFGLVFVSKAARERYYDNTFRRQLFALMQQGYIERLTLSGRGVARTCWRWKEPADLSAIKEQADLAEVN